MSMSKYYCLKCERPNNCNCGTDEHRFIFAYKLRPPLNTQNKVRFREFLAACPEFSNCVPENLRSDFIKLLEKVKYTKTGEIRSKWKMIDERYK